MNTEEEEDDQESIELYSEKFNMLSTETFDLLQTPQGKKDSLAKKDSETCNEFSPFLPLSSEKQLQLFGGLYFAADCQSDSDD